ncbi:MAG: hypothetical protein ACT4QD_04040 [Acidobacteriota bacterium]
MAAQGPPLNPGPRVLVAGVFLTERENTASHVVAELARSADWQVDQQWVAAGIHPVPRDLSPVTAKTVESVVPKFVLLNNLFSTLRLGDYAFILVCDDDILLPPGFLDKYLQCVREYDLALCQPARTHDSYIDHSFVEQLDGLVARRTWFVEIGPLFSIRSDAFSALLPFDESSPMGWGYDLVWPRVIESIGLKMGIVDATPVAHSVRRPVAHYDHRTADQQMQQYLQRHSHLSPGDAFFIVESHA